MSEGETWRRVRTLFDEKMSPRSPSSTSPVGCTIRALALWPGRILVPVIFIPGIMGTNLKNKEEKAWVPPNGALEGLGEALGRSRQPPKDRQKQLTADDCDVYERNDAIKFKDSYLALDEEEATRRHWGELHAGSYLPILKELEERLNYPYCDPERNDAPLPQESWQGAISPKEEHWAPKAPLTEDEFASHLGAIYFPVYACGYNWLKSNEDSAQRVIDRIAEVEQRIEGNSYYHYAGKVILITHSMGGLVGRRVAQRIPDKILGVVHGVQPVTGAPVVYRRFKAGTETGGFFDIAGIGAAAVIGWDAADTTPVLGNSPGPMELLPTRHYGSGWLQIRDRNGNEFRLPQGDPAAILEGREEADPYADIYKVSALEKWWGMVDPGLLDPAGKLKDNEDTTPHKYFLKQVDKAKKFHDTVGLTCHPYTYAHYGDDAKHESFSSVIWETSDDLSGVSAEALLNAPRTSAKLTGKTKVEIAGTTYTFKLKGQDGPGDGTVPTPSGEAAKRLEGIRDVFGLTGFDHAFSYHNEIAQHTVLYAVGKLVQQITIKEDGTTCV